MAGFIAFYLFLLFRIFRMNRAGQPPFMPKVLLSGVGVQELIFPTGSAVAGVQEPFLTSRNGAAGVREPFLTSRNGAAGVQGPFLTSRNGAAGVRHTFFSHRNAAAGVQQIIFPTGRVAAGVHCHFQTQEMAPQGLPAVKGRVRDAFFSHRTGKTGLRRYFVENGKWLLVRSFQPHLIMHFWKIVGRVAEFRAGRQYKKGFDFNPLPPVKARANAIKFRITSICLGVTMQKVGTLISSEVTPPFSSVRRRRIFWGVGDPEKGLTVLIAIGTVSPERVCLI